MSTFDKLASNINFAAIGKAQELKKRILFVVGALVVYRIGTYIPLPGLDARVIEALAAQHSGGLLEMFNMFSGGALSRMTIFALNVMPYITVSIIMQLLTFMHPPLAALRKEGEAGRQKIQQYTRVGTVFMAAFQGYGIAQFLLAMNIQGNSAVIIDPNLFVATTVISLVGGTMFLMWLGEQITQRGIGQGTSLIIFAGIVAGFPSAIAQTLELGRTGALASAVIIIIIALALSLIALIVFVERAQRRIVVQYPKRTVGNKQYQGESSYLPLKLNTAGVLPPIFASSLLLFPATLVGFTGDNPDGALAQIVAMVGHGKPLYIALLAALITFFCFFYMNNVFNPTETADNLKKNGGFIPGIRPGTNTAEYIQFTMNRLTVVGAIYLSTICIIPELLIAEYGVPFYLGGTSLLIIVSVTMDTIVQIQSHLIAHQYEGLLKKTNMATRSRRR